MCGKELRENDGHTALYSIYPGRWPAPHLRSYSLPVGAPPRAGRRFWHAECTSNEEYGCGLRRRYGQIKGVECEGQRLWANHELQVLILDARTEPRKLISSYPLFSTSRMPTIAEALHSQRKNPAAFVPFAQARGVGWGVPPLRPPTVLSAFLTQNYLGGGGRVKRTQAAPTPQVHRICILGG
jgi:hypothetical protein